MDEFWNPTGQQLEDYNRQAVEDSREPFEGTAMEFLEALRELEEE